MSDSEESWPLPNYDPGKPKHLHAVGVISMNYNAFERTLYSLYRLHLDRKKIPLRLGELYYFTLNEQSRLAAIRAVFDEYERNEKVREVAESSLKFFDWCSNVRNGAVAGVVGIESGVVSGVFNLESSGVRASDWRPRHDKRYHEA